MDEASSQERASMCHPAGSVRAANGDFLFGWEVVYTCCSVLLQCGGFIIEKHTSLAQGCLSLILKVQATLTTESLCVKKWNVYPADTEAA